MANNLTATEYNNGTREGWVPQPLGRGTLDIIWSCMFTMFLCCWTSVCPNAPSLTDTKWQQFRDKLNLACLGLIGPDFLFFIAAGQWQSARRSVKVLTMDAWMVLIVDKALPGLSR
jgi:hypothetical protein